MGVQLLLCSILDVFEKVSKVLGRLEVDFAVVGIHCLLWGFEEQARNKALGLATDHEVHLSISVEGYLRQ